MKSEAASSKVSERLIFLSLTGTVVNHLPRWRNEGHFTDLGVECLRSSGDIWDVANELRPPIMSTPKAILVAEDDRALGSLIRRALTAEAHEVELVSDGNAAVDAFRRRLPDLAIIDLGLPELGGLEVLQALRSMTDRTPALILTGFSDLESRLQCFNLGADDCMLKPFSLRELRARCAALLRRNTAATTVLRHEDLEMNRLDHTVRRSGLAVSLTNKEYELLEFLMLHQGRCVSRAMLLEQVWKNEATTNTNVVDVYINYLRRKFNEAGAPSLITTVRGEGYRIGALQPSKPPSGAQA